MSHAFKKPFCVATSKQYDHTAAVFPRLEAHLLNKHHPSASEQQYLSWEFPLLYPPPCFCSFACVEALQTPIHTHPFLQVAQAFLSSVRFQPHLLFWRLKKARHNKYFLKSCLGSNRKKRHESSTNNDAQLIYLFATCIVLYIFYLNLEVAVKP